MIPLLVDMPLTLSRLPWAWLLLLTLRSSIVMSLSIIGDGAMSGGLAFEGLNNVSSQPNDLLIILNDNDMSMIGQWVVWNSTC